MSLLGQFSEEIQKIVASILPSVVEVRSEYRKRTLNPVRRMRGERFLSYASQGAGVVIDSDGVIVTNQHVLGDGEGRVSVILHDQRRFEASVRGVDRVSDVAVLKIHAANLIPALSRGRSARLGEVVVAVGHPLGFSGSVSLGVVSGEARFMQGPAPLPSVYIQTDAAINAGNSGGVLVGCDGSVLGITTFGFGPATAEGLAFAIPIARAVAVAERLTANGCVRYGTLGLFGSAAGLPADVAAKHGLAQTTALRIDQLDPNGPAARSDVGLGDYLLSVNDQPVQTAEAFLDVLDGDLVGTTVSVRLLRQDGTVAAKDPMVVEWSIP